MNIELISIGSELLNGFTVNTNAARIGNLMFAADYPITKQTSLPDDFNQLAEGIRHAWDTHDLTLCTGGLGPTVDDNTREVVASLIEQPMQCEPEIVAHLKQRYGNKPIALENQATIPRGATFFLSQVGTACPLLFEQAGRYLILLPGVPEEVQHCMEQHILPWIKTQFPNPALYFRQILGFFQIYESEVNTALASLQQRFEKIRFGIYPDLGVIQLHLYSSHTSLEQANAYQAPIKEELLTTFKSHFYSDTGQDLVSALAMRCKAKQHRLAIQENHPSMPLSQQLGAHPDFSQLLIESHYRSTTPPGGLAAELQNVLEHTQADIGLVLYGPLEQTQIGIQLRHASPQILAKTYTKRHLPMMLKRIAHDAMAELFKYQGKATVTEPQMTQT